MQECRKSSPAPTAAAAAATATMKTNEATTTATAAETTTATATSTKTIAGTEAVSASCSGNIALLETPVWYGGQNRNYQQQQKHWQHNGPNTKNCRRQFNSRNYDGPPWPKGRRNTFYNNKYGPRPYYSHPNNPRNQDLYYQQFTNHSWENQGDHNHPSSKERTDYYRNNNFHTSRKPKQKYSKGGYKSNKSNFRNRNSESETEEHKKNKESQEIIKEDEQSKTSAILNQKKKDIDLDLSTEVSESNKNKSEECNSETKTLQNNEECELNKNVESKSTDCKLEECNSETKTSKNNEEFKLNKRVERKSTDCRLEECNSETKTEECELNKKEERKSTDCSLEETKSLKIIKSPPRKYRSKLFRNNIPSPVREKIKEKIEENLNKTDAIEGPKVKPDSTLNQEQEKCETVKPIPSIKVRPLAELLKQEILAVTQEQQLENTGTQNEVAGKHLIRPTIHTRRHTTSFSNGSNDFNIGDQLANMDKESLKYIINNSDTIYNEHLKQQARRRLRDEVRRQLKDIELEQPKDKPTKHLIEDEIVDAIKLPQLLLQEIEKCLGIDISAPEKKEQSALEIEESKSTTGIKSIKNSEETNKESESTPATEKTESKKKLKASKSTLIKGKSKKLIEKNDKCNKKKSQALKKTQIKTMATKRPKNVPTNEKSSLQSSKVKKIESIANIKSKIKDITKQRKSAEPVEETKPEEIPVVIKQEIEMRSSPMKIDNVVIVVSSSEDESEDDTTAMDDKADKGDDDQDSDHSTASNCSSESTKLRYQRKLASDANNIVDSFEKLILPHLKETLAERYRSNHCNNLQSRLHFISCVVTSSEHNSQTFSKMQVAKMQQNLKASDNRIGIEFLLREIVNVVNVQKQAAAARRKEQKEQKAMLERHASNKLNINTPLMLNAELPSERHQSNCSQAESAIEAPTSSHSLMPPTPPRNGTPTPTSLATSNRSLHTMSMGMNYFGLDASVPRLSPGNYALTTCKLENSEPVVLMGDSLTHSLQDIDRRLVENQNRRGFLEEMIMKFQREKSDLELLSLELQSRKFLLLNTVIARNQSTQLTPASTVTPTNSPPPQAVLAAVSQAPALTAPEVSKPKLRQRRALVVKRVRVLPKRKLRAKRTRESPTKEVEEAAPEAPEEKTTPPDIPQPLKIKEEPEETSESIEPKNDVAPISPKRQRLTRSADVPPLQPPPPPPEPFDNMAYELPRILLKSTAQPPPPPPTPTSANTSAAAIMQNFNYDYIPIGRLHNITSPITQIRIHKVYIIASSENGDIYMFNIGNHKLERQIPKHSEAITNMFLCEKESFLYTTSLDGFLKKSSLENLERVVQTVYLKEPLQSIDIDWGVAFIGSRWGSVFTYNIAANKVMDMPLLSTGQSIIAVKATKENVRKIILLGCKGNLLFLHDAATGVLLRRFTIPDGLNVYSLLLDKGHIYCGTQKNEVFKFEYSSGSMTNTMSCGNGAVAMATYGEKYLLVGCYDGFIYVLDKKTGRQMGSFSGPGRLVLALAIAGDKVVTSSKDNSLEILEIPSHLLNLNHTT